MSNLENNCIIELSKQEENQNKNIQPIYQYLKTLKVFSYLYKKNSLSNLDKTFKELANKIKLKKISKNELIKQQGDINQNFYIVLNGHLKMIILRPYEYYMSEEEYILYLLQSRINNQTEIIHQCKHFNSLVYPIPYDNFDTFVQDLANKETKAGIYLDSQKVIKKAKEICDIISKEKKNESELSNNDSKIFINPEDYIKKHKVSDNVIYNTILINSFINNNNIDNNNNDNKDDVDKIKVMMKDRKKVTILNYEIYADLETGSFFGQIALGKQGGIQECTIICVKDESYLGYINKNDYELLIHQLIERRNTKIFNIILYFSLYRPINQALFEKKYLNFFIDRFFDINNIIFNEGDESGEMYFISDGEYELSVNKNIIEVNELIIKYKETLKKINKNNKINSNYLNTDEEIKQNNSLIINQKFRTISANKLIMDKRYIKLNILHKKDIIGLADVFLYNNDSENYNKNNDDNNYKPTIIYGEQVKKKCLVTCKCLTYNCHSYSLSNNIFNNLYYNEGNYNISTKILEIKKICSFIERLQSHKEYIFELVNKEQNKYSKTIKKLKFFTKNPKLHQKGKLDPNTYHNILTDIKTIELNDKYNKINDIIKKQYKKYSTINSNINNTPRFNKKIKTKDKDKFDFNKLIFPSISKNKKSNIMNKYSLKLKLMQKKQRSEKKKDETIFELYNINKNISQDNFAKLLIHDFLYEKYFYNYTFNVLNSNNFNYNRYLNNNNYFKTINEQQSNDNKNYNYNNNIKIIENNHANSFSCDKTPNVINIQKININDKDNNIKNNNSLYHTILDRNNQPDIYKSNINNQSDNQSENYKNNIISISVDGKNSEKRFENKIISTIPTTEHNKNKIRLTKIKPCNIYDPLAFDKFNNFFKINFRRKYIMPNYSND